jgi:hypothetical protein
MADLTPNSKLDKQAQRRALFELAIGYLLILVVIWTPRPWQRVLWLVAVAGIAVITCLSIKGSTGKGSAGKGSAGSTREAFRDLGLRKENFLRSLWVVGVALVLASVALVLAVDRSTLELPVSPTTHEGGLLVFFRTFWGYALWTFVQQFLLQGFFLLRLLRLMPGPRSAAFAAAFLFALAHLPNPVLAPLTLVWGFASCLVFLRYRNLYPLAIAHAIFGITIAITIPSPIVRNMRVGLGYLRYAHRHPHTLLQPQ